MLLCSIIYVRLFNYFHDQIINVNDREQSYSTLNVNSIHVRVFSNKVLARRMFNSFGFFEFLLLLFRHDRPRRLGLRSSNVVVVLKMFVIRDVTKRSIFDSEIFEPN